MASAMRDSSPPEATLLTGRGVLPAWPATRKLTSSSPVCMGCAAALFRPGDALAVHKHLNEDELIFMHRGSGLFMLGDKQYEIKEGAVALVPKGVWHGLRNTGNENIEMRFGYTPSGFEGFFREAGDTCGTIFY